MAVIVRDATAADGEFILSLNAASTPAVSEMSREALGDISAWANRILVAEAGGVAAGFIILVRPGSAYPSDNYAWFEQHFPRHLYIDRVAVRGDVRAQGIGRALYEEALRLCRELGEERLTAEVNEDPPNPESMAFHARLGFRHLLSRRSLSGKTVAMLERPL